MVQRVGVRNLMSVNIQNVYYLHYAVILLKLLLHKISFLLLAFCTDHSSREYVRMTPSIFLQIQLVCYYPFLLVDSFTSEVSTALLAIMGLTLGSRREFG